MNDNTKDILNGSIKSRNNTSFLSQDLSNKTNSLILDKCFRKSISQNEMPSSTIKPNNNLILDNSFRKSKSQNEMSSSVIKPNNSLILDNSFRKSISQNEMLSSAIKPNNSLILDNSFRKSISQNEMSSSAIKPNNSLILDNSFRKSISQNEMSSSTIKYIESIKNKYTNLPSIDVNNLVLKELTDECKHLKNLNEVHLKLNKELESKLELKSQENKNEIDQLKEKYESMINNIQEVDNKKTGLLQNKIKLLENQLIETNESQAQIASIQRNFQQQQELNIINIKNDLIKKYENKLQEIIMDKENFLKKVESDLHMKQAEFNRERSYLQEEVMKMKEELEKKNEQILEMKTLLEKPTTEDFSQQYDKGLEETQNKLDLYKTEVDSIRSILYSNISYEYDNPQEPDTNTDADSKDNPNDDDVEYSIRKKNHENYLRSLSLIQLLETYVQQVNHNNEQISKLKIIDKNKDDYVNEMEKQIKNLEITQNQLKLENQNSLAFVENKYLNEINEQKNRYENELIELRNKYEKIIEELRIKSNQMEEISSKKNYPKSTLSELMEIYPNEFEEFKSEIESVVWKKLDEAWHARFKEDLTTASSRITQHCSEAYASAIAKLKTQSIAFKNKLENEFEKKFKKYVEERNKETNHLKHKYEQNQKQLEEMKNQLAESKKTVKSLTQITHQHSQTEEKYHQALLDMKSLYKSRLKIMYEDISKKKKEWNDQKTEIEKTWENKYNALKSDYYNKIKKAEDELKIIKSQIPLKQRILRDVNNLEDQPDRESINNGYTESELYSNPDDESYEIKYYSRN